MSLLIIIWIVRLLFPILQMPIIIAEVVMLSLKILATLILVLLTYKILNVLRDRADVLSKKTQNKMDEHLVPILFRILKIIVAIFALIHVFSLLNINLTALIAGLSIGGLALALAAQDTVKNFIGSALILFDQPFQIGDYIEGAGYKGTVIEVGFRSTRLMTSDTSIVSIPNGNLAGASITNKGLRALRLMSEMLTIEYDTTPQQIKDFIGGLKEIISSNPLTKDQEHYVYLHGLGEYSIQVLFRCYLQVSGWEDELKLKQDILMRILDLANTLEVRFAYPTRKIIQTK